PARPVVGRAARLHDDQANISIGKPALELSASEPVFLSHAPGHVGYGQLEDGLCQIDGDGCSIHVGLLSFEDLIHTPMKTSAPMWRQKRGESIPSVNSEAGTFTLGSSCRLASPTMNSRPDQNLIEHLNASLQVIGVNAAAYYGGSLHAYRPLAAEIRKLLCDSQSRKDVSLLPRCFPGIHLHPL